MDSPVAVFIGGPFQAVQDVSVVAARLVCLPLLEVIEAAYICILHIREVVDLTASFVVDAATGFVPSASCNTRVVARVIGIKAIVVRLQVVIVLLLRRRNVRYARLLSIIADAILADNVGPCCRQICMTFLKLVNCIVPVLGMRLGPVGVMAVWVVVVIAARVRVV